MAEEAKADGGAAAAWEEWEIPPRRPPPPTFVQAQEGDLCRMHAINAYLGGPYLDRATFHALCDVFDEEHAQPRGTSFARGTIYFEEAATYVDSSDNVMAFIIGLVLGRPVTSFNYLTRHGFLLQDVAERFGASSAFVYTRDHVFYARLAHDGLWYVADSLGARITAAATPPRAEGFLLILDGGRPEAEGVAAGPPSPHEAKGR